MKINDVEFNVDLDTILEDLSNELTANNIPLLQTRKDTVDNIMVCCPYHKDGQERRPSAGIRKSDGLLHCFTCGVNEPLQCVISHCFGEDELVGAFGWRWLLHRYATVSVETRELIQFDFSRDNKTNVVDKPKYVTDDELDTYRYYHPYMYKRKLTDEIIELFDIGYDKRTQCITFPIRDITGNTLFIARRSVNTKYFNYPQGAEKPLYGLYELMQMKTSTFRELFSNEFVMDEIIVCESMLDALTAWVYGKPAVALNGLGNELQFEQLRKLPFRKLILATDNDDAGMRARGRIRRNVKNKLISEYILPDGKKDINDLTKEEFDALREVY